MLGAFYGRLSAVAKQQGALMARAGPGGTASGRREGRQIRLSPGLPVGRFQKNALPGAAPTRRARLPRAHTSSLAPPLGALTVLTVLTVPECHFDPFSGPDFQFEAHKL